MKKRHYLIIGLIVCLTIISLGLFGANSNLINLGFENGNFTGWTGYTRVYSTDVPTSNTPWVQVALPNSRRQVIMSDTTAYDPTVGYLLKIIPKGYKYSARLGDVITSADVTQGNNMGFRCWQQKLQYKLAVDSTNALLIMKFACVLQYASDHSALVEPRFKLTLYDSSGNEINTCTNYDVYSSSNTVKGFQNYTSTNSILSIAPQIQWRDWTTVGADLSAYKGQTITLEFMSTDCTGRFHFGYVYFVADYQPMKISTDFCGSSDTARLTAPTGFESYRWRDVNTNKVANTDTTLSTLAVPMSGKDSVIYHCIMRSATGCIDSLSTTILKYKPVASFTAKMVGTCTDNNVEFTNQSTTNRGRLAFRWDYGDGTNDTISGTHIHHYTTSGHHPVKLIVYNPPSTCSIDTIKDVESINTDLVGLKADQDSICIGSSTGKLRASGAWTYEWSTNPGTFNIDSIKSGLPAGTYWVKGYDSTHNCTSNKHYTTISDESEWMDSIQGHNWFCTGDSTKLYASGWYVNMNKQTGIAKTPLTYRWNNGALTDTITTNKAGTYTVIATDKWGCSRTSPYNVKEKVLPLINFTVSPNTINSKRNLVSCSINQEPSVLYNWTFGDNTGVSTGNSVIHYYNQNLPSALYTIALKDSDTVYGCTNSGTTSILLEPFVPNVFTPNGDEYNDYFMPNYEMDVYDRYGILVYSGTKESNGWDGSYKGKRLEPDTYFYIIHYTDYNNQKQTIKGYITLIR
ncbi:T9SS type B sorting domain-containing protein [Paludibacter sp.]|uniref:T9SS type B sorting domain-containing protein n=1 Tax=Paludibacter sp. TaxID=1898105 RepID=UPI0013529E91|nr:T9SS type B sorting domain-containing protein [Paludibacter sp.]MTK52338.1 T9SS type B sorting domain-containing protein [Paludibacter sp.]